MNTKDLVIEKLYKANQLNNNYCDIYDASLQQKIGQTIAYEEMMKGLNIIRSQAGQHQDELDDIPNDSFEDSLMVKSINDYLEVLNVRIEILNVILKKLNNKANKIGEKYGFFSYRKDLKMLNELEKRIEPVGEKLQIRANEYMKY